MGIRVCKKKNKRENYFQLLNFSTILERAEYDPMTEDIVPTMMIKTHSIIYKTNQNIVNGSKKH